MPELNADELHGRGQQIGMFLAALSAPGTFAPTFMPRSPVDQGIVTGLTTTLNYVLSVGANDVIEAIGATFAPYADDPTRARRRTTLALDLAAIPVGAAVWRLLRAHENESVVRGLLRQTAWRVGVTGGGGLAYRLVERGGGVIADWVGVDPRRLAGLLAVPAGLAAGVGLEALQQRRHPEAPGGREGPPLIPSSAAALGVTGGLIALAYVESLVAHVAGSGLARVLPGSPQLWRLTGHGVTLGLLGGGAYALWDRAMQRIESSTSAIEPTFDERAHHLVDNSLSGGPGSLVPWESLGREGRRHIAAYVRERPRSDRPAGMPDLSIETVTGEPAKATPIQVYVGLDSAPTVEERVALALAEMDRTGAWDRSLLLLISPTGTGYVNYVASAAVEYLTGGDMASVTMQYSKRPSPLSLRKIKEAREQNRLLWMSIVRRLRARSGPSPRVVLFGESLGAHTSQDVLMHWGTIGPQALGIERALWIGTPRASKWMQQVTGAPRPGIDRDLVTVVNDFGQIEAMPLEQRKRLRYVLVSHDNDGVTKFSADLLVLRPAWLREPRPPVEAVDGASPAELRLACAGDR